MVRKAGGFIVFRRLFDHNPVKADEIQYLLVKAAYGEHHWSFPKGYTDRNESTWEAAWRETEEETGLKRNQLRHLVSFSMTLSYPVRNQTKILDLFLAEMIDKKAQLRLDPKECEAYEWVDFEKGLGLLGHETRNVLEQAHSFITSFNFE